MCSYECDPELFNFDYKEDLMLMARDRERVFSLSRFTTMADEDEEKDANAAYSRIYGMGGDQQANVGFGGVGASDI